MQSSTSKMPLSEMPKTRLSCDACSSLKVKCDKQRPTCERCRNNNTTCIYGTSRRSGKPFTRKRPATTQQATLLSTSSTVSIPPVHTVRASTVSPPTPGLFASMMTTNASTAHHMPPAITSSVPDLPNISLDDQMHFDIPESLFPPFDSTNAFDFDFPMLNAQSPEFHAWDVPFLPQSPYPQGPTDQPAAQTALVERGGVVGKAHDDCQSRAFATLGSIYWGASLNQASRGEEESSAGSKPPLGPVPPPEGPPSSSSSSSPSDKINTPITSTFDQVLNTNRTALHTVAQLLDCSCAHEPHFAMLYASIVSKVLFLYQAASGIHHRAKSLQHHTQSPGTCPSARDPAMKCVGIRPTQIQVGKFVMDDHDASVLRDDLLLREVRRADMVIEKMVSLCGDSTSSGGTHAVGSSSQSRAPDWYEFMSRVLRAELEETVKRIRNMGPASSSSQFAS